MDYDRVEALDSADTNYKLLLKERMQILDKTQRPAEFSIQLWDQDLPDQTTSTTTSLAGYYYVYSHWIPARIILIIYVLILFIRYIWFSLILILT